MQYTLGCVPHVLYVGHSKMYDCAPIVLTRDKTKEGAEYSNVITGSVQLNIFVRCIIFIIYHGKLGWL